jgi:transglutaminase-like putative cysteine protease
MSRISLRLAAVAAVCLLVGGAFAPAFGSPMTGPADIPGPLLLGVLATVVSAATAVGVCRAMRRGPTIAAIAGLVVVATTVASTVRPGADVLSGPYRLLTAALPQDPHGPELATVTTLTGLITLVSSLIAAYSTWQVSAIIPPAVGLFAAAGLDAGAGEPPAWFAVTTVGVLGMAMTVLRHPLADTTVTSRLSRTRRTLRTTRRIATIVVVLTGASGLVLWTAPILPGVGGQPADARALVSPPVQPDIDVNPLQQYTALRTGIKHVRISGTSSARLDRLRLLALDQFTGSYWTTNARYRYADQRLAISPSGSEVTAHMRVDDPGPLNWLLQPGQPHVVSVPNLGLNEYTGDIVIPPGQSYPSAYDISGTTIPVSSPGLEADTPQALTSPHQPNLASVPDDIRHFAARAKAAPPGYPRLATLQRQLNAQGFVVDNKIDAPGGNGYYQILKLLRGSDGKHAGTSEQYASAFALMARLLGYDARVVLGFMPEYTKNGHFIISGKNVRAWAEVRFARAGWVGFDPTPTATNESPTTSPTSGSEPEEAGEQQDNSRANSKDQSSQPANPIIHGSVQPANKSSSRTFKIALFIILSITLTVLLILTPVVKAVRRHFRRTALTPSRAIHGAWLEALDRVVEHGFRIDRQATSCETAAKTPIIVRQHMQQIAELLDEACYAPEDATDAASQAAWDHCQTAHDILRQDAKLLKRIVAVVNPRSIWRTGLPPKQVFWAAFLSRLGWPPPSGHPR